MSTENRFPSMLLQIRSSLQTLTAAERRVAEYVLENPGDVLQFSVSDLSTNSQTSDATVIRFIRKLGLASYSELKVHLAQSMVAPVKTLDSDIEVGDSVSDVIRKVFAGVSNALNMTRDIAQYADLEAAADLLYSAKHIFLIGFGNSASSVADFQQKLLRLGLPVTVQYDPHILLIDILSYAGPDTVCLAVSHSGHSKLVTDAAQACREKGSRIITLTDMVASPLSEMADISLHTVSTETRYNLYAAASKIAQYTILDVLYTIMSYKHADTAFDRFSQIESRMRLYKI